MLDNPLPIFYNRGILGERDSRPLIPTYYNNNLKHVVCQEHTWNGIQFIA